MTTYRTAARGVLVVAVTVVGLLGAACGDSDDQAMGSADAVHNEADIAFVEGMIPHHEQAVTMSQYAASRAASREVKDLAKRIEAAQQPEIEQMKAFLATWGVKASGEHGGHGGDGGELGDGGHSGMLTEEQLDRLEAAKGEEFDRLFLEGMIEHHRGAITASEKEEVEGRSPEAKALAGEIITAQRAEIAEMEQLLAAT